MSKGKYKYLGPEFNKRGVKVIEGSVKIASSRNKNKQSSEKGDLENNGILI